MGVISGLSSVVTAVTLTVPTIEESGQPRPRLFWETSCSSVQSVGVAAGLPTRPRGRSTKMSRGCSVPVRIRFGLIVGKPKSIPSW